MGQPLPRHWILSLLLNKEVKREEARSRKRDKEDDQQRNVRPPERLRHTINDMDSEEGGMKLT